MIMSKHNKHTKDINLFIYIYLEKKELEKIKRVRYIMNNNSIYLQK